MKKRYLTLAVVTLLLCSTGLTSCIGSFRLTGSVLKWNKQVGSKFLNEVVFFAFWVLPVYEVTALADVLVLNSIEFWSGKNPLTASVKTVETPSGNYLVECDGNGYTITSLADSSIRTRMEYNHQTRSWALVDKDGQQHVFMTFVDGDDTRVRVIGRDGEFQTVELSEQGVREYAYAVGAEDADLQYLAMNN